MIKSSPDRWFQKKKADVICTPSKYPDWRVEDDHLYLLSSSPRKDPTLPDLNRWKTVVPPGIRQAVIRDAHNCPYAAHCGVEKTYHRVASYFY